MGKGKNMRGMLANFYALSRPYYSVLIIIILILISGCIQKQVNEKEREFAGETLHFRANLTEADLVPVYPDENYVKGLFFKPKLGKIQIAFIPKDGENGFYGVAGYELAYKLVKINQYYFQQTVIPVETLQLNSTGEINKLTNEEGMNILMLGPSNAKETSVKVEGNLVILSGVDFSEVDRDYTDLDLAVDKFLLILMDAEKA